ncbi:YhbY family RNA-binding protein [Acinetobacter baumannii]
MAALSIHERKRLRQIGHVLNPVVMIGGQGLTDAVIEETLRALNDHELIKVKIAGEDREARAAVIDAIVEATGAEAVQKIGKIVSVHDKNR